MGKGKKRGGGGGNFFLCLIPNESHVNNLSTKKKYRTIF